MSPSNAMKVASSRAPKRALETVESDVQGPVSKKLRAGQATTTAKATSTTNAKGTSASADKLTDPVAKSAANKAVSTTPTAAAPSPAFNLLGGRPILRVRDRGVKVMTVKGPSTPVNPFTRSEELAAEKAAAIKKASEDKQRAIAEKKAAADAKRAAAIEKKALADAEKRRTMQLASPTTKKTDTTIGIKKRAPRAPKVVKPAAPNVFCSSAHYDIKKMPGKPKVPAMPAGLTAPQRWAARNGNGNAYVTPITNFESIRKGAPGSSY